MLSVCEETGIGQKSAQPSEADGENIEGENEFKRKW
jgi:hypothetical protein